jgi:DNA-binding IclR family transcriptional regulator
MFATMLAPLSEEVGAVLAALAAETPASGLKLNDLTARTGLPTGHVGRHLRTLESERLARYDAGAWHATLRGQRHPAAEREETTRPLAA